MAEENNRCPECGTSLAPDAAPGQLCPRCLLSIGLEPDTDPGSTEAPAEADGTKSTEINAVESTQSGHIGPYRLTRKLGEGGMGEVYEAEQQEPVRRKVALKLIKWGMDTRRVVARFEAERQALAMMDHPCIARVFDAGATDQGRPYFAMELVKGVPITDYCDRHKLSTRQRLELFALVCEGVQHAHQKGIIHRDIKPSNVMVTIQDDKPVPKIIDFGVAKATEQRLTEKTVFTELGQLVGTPEYMSPEQAEMTGLDIDTRTDVYSLGVLLYELLSGALPFEPRELRKAGYDEIRRRIREDEPAKPSTRISSLGEEATTAASNRNTAPGALVRRLRGDLDWISMKALEKDRTRRYGSAADLAADLGRHLQSEPVLAGPPSTAYRMKKFVRRHRFGVAAAGIVLAALVIGAVGTTVGMVRAVAAEKQARAEARRAEASNLYSIGQNVLEDNPSGALAYATASLELSDNSEVRQFALKTLWRGPTVFVTEDMGEGVLSLSFGPDGNRLAAGGWHGIHNVWRKDGSSTITTAHSQKFYPSDATNLSEETAEQPSHNAPRTTVHGSEELVFVEFDDDGKYHVSSSDQGVQIWSLPEGPQARSLDVRSWWCEVRGQRLLAFSQIGDTSRFQIRWWPLAGGGPEDAGVWRRPDGLTDAFALLRFDVDATGEWLAYSDGPELWVQRLDELGVRSPRRVATTDVPITRVQIHPDGEHIATMERVDDQNGLIRLWHRDGRSAPRTYDAPLTEFSDAPAARSRTIRFDPGGRWMSAVTQFGKSTLLWDLSAPPGAEPLILRSGVRQPMNSTALHPAGDWVAAADVSLAVWPLSRSYAHVLQRQPVSLDNLVVDPEGKWVATASWDGTVRRWTLTTDGAESGEILFEAKKNPATGLAVTSDGTRIAAGLWDGTVVVVRSDGGAPTKLTGFGTAVFALTFDREGRRLAGAGQKLGADCVIRVWDLESGETKVLDAGDQKGIWIDALSFTPEGRLLSSGFGGLRLWDPDAGTFEQLLDEQCDGRLGPDGRYVLGVGGSTGSTVFVYDLRERTSWELPNIGPLPWSLAWHPSGEYVAIGSEDGVIWVSPVAGGDPYLLLGHEGLVSDIVFDPNGQWIVSSSRDGTLRYWPMPEGQPFQALPPEDFLARLRTLTNYRVLPDKETTAGYRLELAPFPGWEVAPTW